MQWLAVAVGGALGAVARFGVNGWLYPLYGNKFPLGTLVVNVLGSLLMGIAYVIILEKGQISVEWRNILMVGFLGAFTTFSTFSLDSLALWQNGHPFLALLYIMLSLILCLFAAYLGIALTRLI